MSDSALQRIEALEERIKKLEDRLPRDPQPTREQANAAARACGFESIEGFFSALERRR